ncbi:MAG: hypothetical protein E5Y10_06920 [Mesorhizobium sp.]|nr:MAG: hypothetical protein E5Y10_06920 [Mesorhizobium sp.]
MTKTDAEIAERIRRPDFKNKLADLVELMRRGSVDLQTAAFLLELPVRILGETLIEWQLEREPDLVVQVDLSASQLLLASNSAGAIAALVGDILTETPEARVSIVEPAKPRQEH